MVIKGTESVDIHTSTGPMRTYLFRPVAEGRYPKGELGVRHDY